MSKPQDIAQTEEKDLIRLVFVGSPLLDITNSCDQNTLAEYGIPEDDCVEATAKHDPLFEKLHGDPGSRQNAGGSTLNSAKIAKWVLGDKCDISLAGSTGTDAFASDIRKDMLSWGVRPLFVTVPDRPTGVCACLLSPGGKRSFCWRLGADAVFSTEHLDTASIRSSLERAHCIFTIAYILTHSPDVVRALADTCFPSQVFSLSLSADYICREHSTVLLYVLHRVDVLLGNEAEVKAFAEAIGMDPETTTTEDAACAFAKMEQSPDATPRIVVVTRGPKPVIVVRGQEPPRHFPVPRSVVVVDSVGCGDALAGAFLAVYVQTRDVDRAVEAGIQTAVEIAQVPGCDPPSKEFTLPS